MECCIDLKEREREKLLEDGGERHEREQLIFIWPLPSRGGRLGDDGCEVELRRKVGKRKM